MSKWSREPEPWVTTVTGTVIWKLNKKRAKTELIFAEDDADPWFIHEYTVERKTQKVTSCSVFIAKDIPSIIAFREREGWVIEELSRPSDKLAWLNK
jgi:hypothetical protein